VCNGGAGRRALRGSPTAPARAGGACALGEGERYSRVSQPNTRPGRSWPPPLLPFVSAGDFEFHGAERRAASPAHRSPLEKVS